MPNNSNARREKDRKKKDRKKEDKNKKTDPPPSHKEDNASTDSSDSSLSQSGTGKASMDSFFLSYAGRDMETLEAELLVPGHEQHVFILGYKRSLSIQDLFVMQYALMEAHPNAHARDLATPSKAQMLKAGLEALKKWRQDAKDVPLPAPTRKK